MSQETCERCGRPVFDWPYDYDGSVSPEGVIVIGHGYYGCDTGCCGLEAIYQKTAGKGGGRIAFDFTHNEAEFIKRFEHEHPRYRNLQRVLTCWKCYEWERSVHDEITKEPA